MIYNSHTLPHRIMFMMTNQEYDVQLQNYLEEQLSLIPDTDPHLLSKLVLALLKMDLPRDELKNLCKEKLEDFLKYRTVQFVDGLFSYISSMDHNQSEEYKTIHANHQSIMNIDQSSIEDDDYDFRRRRQRFGENAYKQIGTEDNASRRGRGITRSRGVHRPFISKRSYYHHTSFIPQNMLNLQGKRLFVNNIPEEFSFKNAIEEYFSKFGPVHLVSHQGNRATIEFENHEHAASAFSSPDPIFQNRFVKLSWDIDTSKQERKEHVSALHKQKEEMIAKYEQQISELQSKLSSALPDQTQELQKSIQILQDSICELQKEKFIGKFSYREGHQGAMRSGNMIWRPTKLDLRPKTITISPIPSPLSGNEENVQKYFGQFGTIISIVFCQNHIEIQYKERYEAENAMKLGNKVSFGNIQFPFTINWKNSIQSTNMNTMTLANNTNDSWDDAYERSWRR